MENWIKLNETSLSEKKDLYNHLNIEYITDADYAHARRVCKDFDMKNLAKYHHLYVPSNILLLADVFENFPNMKLDSPHFLTTSGLAW